MRWYQRFFRRGLTEKHLDAELRFHLDQRIADLVATGMAPEEARRRARLEFGSLDQVKEECRDVGAGRFVETLIQDIRFGLRTMFKDRGFIAAAVLALALGIGSCTAIFSVIDNVLLEPFPYIDSHRIFQIGFTTAPPAKGKDATIFRFLSSSTTRSKITFSTAPWASGKRRCSWAVLRRWSRSIRTWSRAMPFNFSV